jgi:hypothetical protein
MEDTPTVLRFTMDWNPSYSYAKIPDGLKDVPPYYAVLATPVPEAQGLAHFHDIHIWNIKATGAKQVFDVNGNAKAPLEDVRIENFDVEAQSAGKIVDAKDWTFRDMKLKIADGSVVAVKNSTNVVGLPGADAAHKE